MKKKRKIQKYFYLAPQHNMCISVYICKKKVQDVQKKVLANIRLIETMGHSDKGTYTKNTQHPNGCVLSHSI